jgi:hypothetical protein
MPLVKLSDDELNSRPGRREADRARTTRRLPAQQIASTLSSCAEIGPGAVHRAIAAAMREHFDPPNLNPPGPGGKYG